MLPQLHSFVDSRSRTARRARCASRTTGSKTLVTSRPCRGCRAGQVGRCSPTRRATASTASAPRSPAVDEKQCDLRGPGADRDGPEVRRAARQRTRCGSTRRRHCQWRFAPVGKIETTWQKGVLSDISRSGASAQRRPRGQDRQFGRAQRPAAARREAEISLRGDVRRVDKIEGSKKYNVGLQLRAPLSRRRARDHRLHQPAPNRSAEPRTRLTRGRRGPCAKVAGRDRNAIQWVAAARRAGRGLESDAPGGKQPPHAPRSSSRRHSARCVALAVAVVVVRMLWRRRPSDETTERIQSLIDEANRLIRTLEEKK